MGRDIVNMVKKTKLPPGPSDNIPVVGRLYSIYFGTLDFVYFLKWPTQSWSMRKENPSSKHSLKTDTELLELIQVTPYVLLTKLYINELDGILKGSLLIAEKTVDFWIPVGPDETCLESWQSYFLPASVKYDN